MSLETISAIASVGTFVVIAATAIAAVLQMRHTRAANMLSYLYNFFHDYEGKEFYPAFRFVRFELAKRLEDPEFRRELRENITDRERHPEIKVLNFFDQWGAAYREGVLDRESFMRINASLINSYWPRLEPVIAILAEDGGRNMSFEQFEYLVVEARRWIAAHPDGDFPEGFERLPLVDRWAAIDADLKRASGR